jgi:hypothetical protein
MSEKRMVGIALVIELEVPRTRRNARAIKRLKRSERALAALEWTRIDASHMADIATHFESIVETMRRARATQPLE